MFPYQGQVTRDEIPRMRSDQLHMRVTINLQSRLTAHTLHAFTYVNSMPLSQTRLVFNASLLRLTLVPLQVVEKLAFASSNFHSSEQH